MYKIYKITNKKHPSEIYVGSTKRTLEKRFQHHIHYKGSSVYPYIKRDGRENFEITAIDYADTKKEALEKEEFWTLFFKELGYFLYNKQVGNKLSEEQKQILSKKAKERLKNKENHPMYGKHHSEKTREIISKRQKERFKKEKHPWIGKHHSDEAKRKMSEGHKGRCTGKDNHNARKVRCINDGKCFDCIKDAAEFYKIKGTNTHISDVCKGKRSHTHGLHFEYV